MRERRARTLRTAGPTASTAEPAVTDPSSVSTRTPSPSRRVGSERTRECSYSSRPRSISRAAEPEREPGGVERGEVGNHHAAAEHRRVAASAHARLVERDHALGRPQRRGRLDGRRAHVVEAGSGGHAHVSRLVEPGVHVVGPAPVADRAHRGARSVEQLTRGGVAEALAQLLRAQPQRLAEPAVASAGAVAADAALEQRHAQARIGLEQVPRRPQAGEAPADHHHIGVHIALQSRSGSGLTRLLEPPATGGVPFDPHT